MEELPAYSVVVVTYNHGTTLPACLAALNRLQPAPDRVVLVDNASTDGSTEIAEVHAGAIPLQLIRRDSNTGYSAASNTGIARTASPWLLSLNPDCAPQPNFVASLLKSIQARPERECIGSATGKLLRASGNSLKTSTTIDAAGMVVTASGRHFDRGAGSTDEGQFDRPAWVFGGTGAATLFRREALTDVAYPDGEIFASSFFAYREDAELAWRLQWRGWRCLYDPQAVAAHQRGFQPEGGRRGHDAINRLSVQNRFLLRLHCADLGWHLGCLPWWLFRDLAVVGACCTVERGSLAALGDVWRLRRDGAARRRWVMSRRTESSRQLRRWFRKRGWTREMTI